MNKSVDFEKYLRETLGISIKTEKWANASQLPFFLRDLYSFFQLSLLDTPCLLMVARDEEEQTPATIRKHMEQVKDRWGYEIIYLRSSVSAYNRKRLIEHKVSFVVPGNQMYLPLLGIDLREHFKKARSTNTMFSPATQAVVIHALLFGAGSSYTPSVMASQLGYAVMTLTRAFDELESAGLGDVTMEGRERVLRFGETRQALWEKALPFMRSPVKKRAFILAPPGECPGIVAGLTALAQNTMLAAPTTPIFALSAEEWKSMKMRNDFVEMAIPAEPRACEVEIWKYPPNLFSDNNVVDRFSLYLSLQDSQDERVELALEEMMENVAW